ncbi:MAG: FkbM family methyltransferase, partial [Haliea sp.]
FGRRVFSRFNRLLFRLSLNGLGVMNYKTSKVSGERSFLRNYLLGKNGVLIDVGANGGQYSKEALEFNPALRIYAIEPHPVTFKLLSENLHGENVVKINKGLSGQRGTLKLYDYKDRDGSAHASLFRDVITEIHGAGTAVDHDVELVTLDEIVFENDINEVSLLKIDTEGNELEVLRGGENTLTTGKIKAIHFEFNEMNVSSRVFFRDFWKMLANYKLYRMLPNDLLEIKSYHPLECEIFAYQNIIAILEEK